MRLAVSAIAWDVGEDEAVAGLLGRLGIDAIDIVPARYFTPGEPISDAALRAVRHWWSTRGLEITGMQALLFGTHRLQLFDNAASRDAMWQHLAGLCRICGALGGRKLVFGSPRNRDRGSLEDRQVQDIAVDFFARLGVVARQEGVTICLEPNPRRYGANFMTTCAETYAMVRAVDDAGIAMQFDTGSLAVNGEDPVTILRDYGATIGHVHCSEPDLIPIGNGTTDHAAMAKALRESLPHCTVAVEMLATRDESHLQSIERAARVALTHYGDSTVFDGT